MSGPKTPQSNLSLRLLTAAVWVPFIFYMLYWGPAWLFPSVAGVVCAFAGFELMTMIAPAQRSLRTWCTLMSALWFVLVGFRVDGDQMALGVVTLVAGGMLVSLARPQPLESAALRMGWTIAAPFYVGTLFGALQALFRLEHGGSWVLLSLACAFISDTAGYFVGRAFGKHKLAPIVSPKKTVEGSLGGLLGGMASGVIAYLWFLPIPLSHALLVSLLATAAGQAGDLCESLIKRSVGVKDSGTILPGHGGVMDRSDAMLFSAGAIYVYAMLFLS